MKMFKDLMIALGIIAMGFASVMALSAMAFYLMYIII